jgi:hypothetical protein
LLKLGIDIGQTSVAKYMARRRGPPSQVSFPKMSSGVDSPREGWKRIGRVDRPI